MDKTLEQILEEYKDVVRAKAGIYFILGADKDDVIQEGMIGLVKAYNSFDENGGASFKTYANRCIDNQIINAIQHSARQKNIPLNSSIEIPDTSIAGPVSNPEDAAIYRDFFELLKNNKNGIFSPFEHKVFLLLADGLSCTEIAAKLGKSTKSADNAVQRVRNKIKNYMTQD